MAITCNALVDRYRDYGGGAYGNMYHFVEGDSGNTNARRRRCFPVTINQDRQLSRSLRNESVSMRIARLSFDCLLQCCEEMACLSSQTHGKKFRFFR